MNPTKMLAAVVDVYTLVVFVRVVFSWLPVRHRENELYRFIFAITEPVLRPVRRLVPLVGGLDLSPLAVIVLLSVVRRLLIGT